LLSTFPPTQCGLATFTAALLEYLPAPGDRVGVVRVLDEPAGVRPTSVVCDLVNGSAASASAAVDALDDFDVVLVQHEYGIYGGADGQDVVPLLDAVSAPIVAVLHTVLAHPTDRQRSILDDVVRAATAVVTMTETARRRLVEIYGVDVAKVSVIPHGAVDNRVHDLRIAEPLREATPAPRRSMMLTWGLLGPGKGIEHAIDAVALLRDRDSDRAPIYVIAGETHPKVLARDGQAYRESLQARALALGVQELVRFDPRYLDAESLNRLIASADVVVLPYDSAEQVTSGVLIEAVTAGKPVVSTNFPHAVELLSSGAGILTPRHDPGAIADAVQRMLREPGTAEAAGRESARLAPGLLWSAVASSYRALAAGLVPASADATAGAAA
jgi:glycosyltransferase involved in cell wall biosynthesis